MSEQVTPEPPNPPARGLRRTLLVVLAIGAGLFLLALSTLNDPKDHRLIENYSIVPREPAPAKLGR